jgi:hypothetical protein
MKDKAISATYNRILCTDINSRSAAAAACAFAGAARETLR